MQAMLGEINLKLEDVEKRLMSLRKILQIESKEKEVVSLSEKMSKKGFWQNTEQSLQIISQLKRLKNITQPWQELNNQYKELMQFKAILKEDDKDLSNDLNRTLDELIVQLTGLEFRTFLSAPFDSNNAIVSINAGAGGTEACDWAQMLFRMYCRWAEQKGYKNKTIDVLMGEEAGIKNVTIFIEGEYAYGYLKGERGVHRLVRISPFDANRRRHTSFASVDVIPEVEEERDSKIEEKDLCIETFRASGPGGQHMQKADSAVRITHLPTGIVCQCQNERSQYQNKQIALKVLKARLYELERQKKEKLLSQQLGRSKQKIEWGSQIRSYVLHPYNLAKDHRTNFETGNVSAVLDGAIDGFIEAFLRIQKAK